MVQKKPLDPDLRPEQDKGLQKHVLAQPAKIVPTGPVATATGPAPPTPYMPRAIPQIKLPVKVAPPTPASPPRIPRPTPKIPQTPQQIRPRNLRQTNQFRHLHHCLLELLHFGCYNY